MLNELAAKGTSDTATVTARLAEEFGIGTCEMSRLLAEFSMQKSAGCAWGCSGHNLPQHNK